MKRRARLCVAAVGLLAIIAGVVVLLGAPQDAYALRVTMKRVIFEGPKRTEILTIVNNTADEQVYRLGWRMMRMTEDRSLEYVQEGDPADDLRPAEDMVRYSPRRIVLPPGASQQVRLMLRRPKDLPDGEYRSHFWIQPEAEAVKFTPDENKPKSDKPSIQIKMLTGMTVPVFIRSGAMDVKASITDGRLSPDKDGVKVSFSLNRTGNRSTYGDLTFFCVGSGGEVQQKEVRGIAVYAEVNRRLMEFPVPFPAEGGAAACRQVRVKYTAEDDDPLFKGAVMADAVIGG